MIDTIITIVYHCFYLINLNHIPHDHLSINTTITDGTHNHFYIYVLNEYFL